MEWDLASHLVWALGSIIFILFLSLFSLMPWRDCFQLYVFMCDWFIPVFDTIIHVQGGTDTTARTGVPGTSTCTGNLTTTTLTCSHHMSYVLLLTMLLENWLLLIGHQSDQKVSTFMVRSNAFFSLKFCWLKSILFWSMDAATKFKVQTWKVHERGVLQIYQLFILRSWSLDALTYYWLMYECQRWVNSKLMIDCFLHSLLPSFLRSSLWSKVLVVYTSIDAEFEARPQQSTHFKTN